MESSLDESVRKLIHQDSACGFPLAVCSLQAGLYAVLRAFGVGPGSEVVCDPIFPYAALAAVHSGARPVFPSIGNSPVLSPSAWQESCTTRTKAILATKLFDTTAPDIVFAPNNSGIPVILDCALSPGTTLGSNAFVQVVGYSFNSGKPVSCGQGGLLVFQSSDARDATEEWCQFGVSESRPNKSEIRFPGLNFGLSPALLPILRANRALLDGARERLALSWSAIDWSSKEVSEVLPTSGSFGWYRAFILPPGACAADQPEYLCAAGVKWKRCFVELPACSIRLFSDVSSSSSGAHDTIQRLVWYRPEISSFS